MKKIKKKIYTFILAAGAVFMSGCSFLEPLPDGSYNDENFELYPELMRGFVDKVYNDYFNTHYYNTYYVGMSAATDDALYRSETASWRMFSNGAAKMASNPFAAKWNNNYSAINYLNMFLKDDVGYNMRYMLNSKADLALRDCLQGSAYGLRAWMHFDLLRAFGGIAEDGRLLGVPIRTEATEATSADASTIERATFDECVEQILDDCDEAYKYLPQSNRDYPDDPPQEIIVTGSARYKTLDQVSIDALRAMVYIMWASPAYNPDQDMTRYDNAAKYAAKVMKHKIEREGSLSGGFDPAKGFSWLDCNGPEIIWASNCTSSMLTETNFYPQGFGGAASVVPTQELVDAFPMKNGYPITDSRSNYDSANPYADRDPRFYATIFYNGAQVLRNTNAQVMYTIESAEGGKDAPGGTDVSPTGYYTKKFIYTGWNPNDNTVLSTNRCILFMRWTQMCLIFAEAANKTVGPFDDATYGYSAKQVVAWIRNRPTNDGTPGLGIGGDPYLDECAAAGTDDFHELIKNEWRLETCFEGDRFYHCRRWATDVSELNIALRMASIKDEGGSLSYEYSIVENLRYPSLWVPLPYTEVRKCPKLLQNKGWETWK